MKQIATALLAAQKQLEGVSKDATNPHFGNDFASLAAVIDAVVPILNKNGIVVIQLPAAGPEGHLSLSTILLHESGESIVGISQVPLSKQDPQAYGSAMTYARRYSLAAAVSLKLLDDDAEAAVGRVSPPKATTPAPPKGLMFGKPKVGSTAKAPERPKAKGLFPKVSSDEQAETVNNEN